MAALVLRDAPEQEPPFDRLFGVDQRNPHPSGRGGRQAVWYQNSLEDKDESTDKNIRNKQICIWCGSLLR